RERGVPSIAIRQNRLGDHPVRIMTARRNPASLVSVLFLACVGCGDGSSDRPASSSAPGSASSGSGPRLMFITNGTSDWWNAVEKGMNDGAAEFKAQVEMRRNKEAGPLDQIRL